VKVLVVNTAIPYVRGGAEELADHLVARLNAVPGVTSELLRIPFNWIPSERLIEEVLIAKMLRIQNVDRVIALKFPGYLVPHQNKSLWLLHQFRQAYDLADVGQGLADHGRDKTIKEAIRQADCEAFAACRSIFVNSPVTQDRLKRYNGFPSEVLYPPVNDEQLFAGGEAQGYIFAGGRLGGGKRQHLLLEALATMKSPARMLIAGPPESEDYAQRLRGLVERHGLGSQVELRFGFHPREQVAAWVNGASACAYLPYDEDSLGYVTMEAFTAGKAVLTTTDSGGLLEIVSEETGFVASPTADSIAEGLALLSSSARSAADRGRAAKALWDAKGITWPDTVAKLIA
jgi:glycosyltransferase involved in cell wall biosynthesis